MPEQRRIKFDDYPGAHALAVTYEDGQIVAIWSSGYIGCRDWEHDPETGKITITVYLEKATLRYGQEVKCPECGEWVGPENARTVAYEQAYCSSCRHIFPIIGAERNPDAVLRVDEINACMANPL